METSSVQVQIEKILVVDLDQEWEKFNKKLQTKMSLEGNSGFQTPQHTQQVINLETKIQETITTQDIKVILAHPTSEIVLNIEEIPTLDIFYSPTHRL